MATRLQKPGRASGAGKLKARLAFESRPVTSDGYGGITPGWQERFQANAELVARFGGEEIQAARLVSRQPYSVTVRQSSKTRLIDSSWRARDVRRGTIFNIRSVADPDGFGAWLEMLCETGVEA